MTEQTDDILDLPEKSERKIDRFKGVRIAALGSFIIALFLRNMAWPWHPLFIVLGSAFFLIWAGLRFYHMKNRRRSESLYLPARILLISGLSIRYLGYWQYDYLLVYSGLALFVLGWIFAWKERP